MMVNIPRDSRIRCLNVNLQLVIRCTMMVMDGLIIRSIIIKLQGIIIRYVTVQILGQVQLGISIWMNTVTGDLLLKGNMILFLDVKSIAVDMQIEIMCIHIRIAVMNVYLSRNGSMMNVNCKTVFIWCIRIK